MRIRPGTHAFSLVEMAIVLAIIGLLAGGVVGGQSLLRNARLNTITSDFNKFRNAIQQFQQTYQALPGDYVDATEVWGSDTGTACSNTPAAGDRVPKKVTCNGNADGYIGYNGPAIGTASWYETYRSWQHLANAGLIEGSFTGVAGAGGGFQDVPDQNTPGGPINGTGYGLYSIGAYGGDTYYNAAKYGPTIHFGLRTGSTGYFNPALTPREAHGIDKKIDDAKPATGRILSFKSAGPYWTGCAAAGNAAYALGNSDIACGILYITKFQN